MLLSSCSSSRIPWDESKNDYNYYYKCYFKTGDVVRDEVRVVFKKALTEREQKVLKLRFGLEDGRARTLEEVGKEFDVTRERIRQIEAKALRKLRHPTRSKKLKDYLE